MSSCDEKNQEFSLYIWKDVVTLHRNSHELARYCSMV